MYTSGVSNFNSLQKFSYKNSTKSFSNNSFDSGSTYSSGFPVRDMDSHPSVHKPGTMIVTKTPKDAQNRPHLKQTTLSFPKRERNQNTITSISYSSLPSPSKTRDSQNVSNSLHYAPKSVKGLSLESTISTLSVSECLTAQVIDKDHAVLPSQFGHSSRKLYYLVCFLQCYIFASFF